MRNENILQLCRLAEKLKNNPLEYAYLCEQMAALLIDGGHATQEQIDEITRAQREQEREQREQIHAEADRINDLFRSYRE